MAKKESMAAYAKRRGNEQEAALAKKEAGMAPSNTTGMSAKAKRQRGKDSKDSKDGGPDGWKKGAVRDAKKIGK